MLPRCRLRQKLMLPALFSIFFSAVAIGQGSGDDLVGIFEQARPSVVALTVFDAGHRPRGQGTGFVIGDDGLIATNERLIENAVWIEATTGDGDVIEVYEIVKTDPTWGIALVRAEKDDLDPLEVAEPGTTKVGQEIVAIGSPRGVNLTLSQGLIVGLLEFQGTNELMQLSNDFSPGMNGGPVLNQNGKLVGLAVSTLGSGKPVHLAVPAKFVASLVAASKGQPAQIELRKLQAEIARTLAARAKVRSELEQSCSADDRSMIDSVIDNAIFSGAAIYNIGDALGCFRIYEGAAYQMLYRVGDRCEVATRVLEQSLFDTATMKSPGQYKSIPAAKAWKMREAFDSLLGETQPREPQPATGASSANPEETGT